jgi:hypothetical protein
LDHLKVEAEAIPGLSTGWDDAIPSYNFSFYSVLMFNFGAFDGALNAMPKGSFLSKCGLNLKKSREDLLNMTNYMEQRELILAVDKLYAGLGHVYNINYNCFYGFEEFLNADYLIKLFG